MDENELNELLSEATSTDEDETEELSGEDEAEVDETEGEDEAEGGGGIDYDRLAAAVASRITDRADGQADDEDEGEDEGEPESWADVAALVTKQTATIAREGAVLRSLLEGNGVTGRELEQVMDQYGDLDPRVVGKGFGRRAASLIIGQRVIENGAKRQVASAPQVNKKSAPSSEALSVPASLMGEFNQAKAAFKRHGLYGKGGMSDADIARMVQGKGGSR